jgi:erythromycin esterase-like protein
MQNGGWPVAVSMIIPLLALFAFTPCVQEPEAISQEAFVSWVEKAAIPVEDWQMNPELESYLEKAIKGKSIVFLGEASHFFHERREVQLLIIRYLVTKGYRHIFLEGLGASTAPTMDHFLQTGKGPSPKEKSGGKDLGNRYQEKAFENWVGAKGSVFKERVSADRVRFFDALRAINLSLPKDSPRLRIHPLDIDMAPGGCYSSIETVLAKYADDAKLNGIRQQLPKVEGETIKEEIKRLESLRRAVAENTDGALNGVSKADRQELEKFADCLVETIVFFQTAREDGELNRALIRRETAMYRQVQFALDGLPENGKAIMIGHNNHLCRDGEDIPRARNPSIGQMVETANPGQVFSIWTLYDHGWLLNPMAKDPIEEVPCNPDRVESVLAKAGDLYLLPIGSGQAGEQYLSQPRLHSYFSWSETATLNRQTDAIFFVAEISPLQK